MRTPRREQLSAIAGGDKEATRWLESLLSDPGGASNGALLRVSSVNPLVMEWVLPAQDFGTIGAIIEDQKASGTDGGTFTAGADQTRVLNTLTYNGLGLPALAANQFTLPAGTYFIAWSAPAYRVAGNQSMLYNATDAVVVGRGSSERAGTAAADTTIRSTGSAVTTITADTAFEIRHRCNTTNITLGFGFSVGAGVEVYTRVEITRMA